MTKVSVIVPIFNSEKYLKKCIDSLINQTLSDMEFILINDGSTDGSDSIVKSYNDSRIKYFKRSNHGIGATRNFGIEKSSGDFIAFLDSDDYVSEDMFYKMYNKCIENNLDIVICDYIKEKDNYTEQIFFNDFGITSLKESPNLLLDVNLAPWNKIYKKEIIKDVKFPVDVKYEDTPFVACLLRNAKRIGKLNLFLYHYRVHSNSETTIVDEKVYDIFKICDILRNNLGFEYKDSVNDLIIYLITTYTISMRYIKNKKERDLFIEEAFIYLKTYIPYYKKSNYFKNRIFYKKIIEKNKLLTKLYCNLYVMIKK